MVANAEENTTEIFRQIERLNIPLYVAFPKTIDDAICDLRRMGALLQSNQQAEQFITQIEQKKLDLDLRYPDTRTAVREILWEVDFRDFVRIY